MTAVFTLGIASPAYAWDDHRGGWHGGAVYHGGPVYRGGGWGRGAAVGLGLGAAALGLGILGAVTQPQYCSVFQGWQWNGYQQVPVYAQAPC